MLVSIVIPCYRSEKSIGKVVELTEAVFSELPNYDCEFILVDDCSPDNTFRSITELVQTHENVRGISLMRNFGQHNAILCGMHHAKGDLVMGMDDDLQTHPAQIPAILGKMEEGCYDVVYGVFKESTNGILKNFTSWLNRVTAQMMLGRPRDIRTSSFWVVTKQIKDQVITFRNYNPYIQALFGRMTNRMGNVEIEHHEREQGSSNYSLSKLVKLWLAYFNYTVLPLRFISAVGMVTACIGFVAGLFVVVRKFVVQDVLLGWSSLTCIMLVFFGLVLLGIGIIGEYLGDLVLSANSTPQFIERCRAGFGEKCEDGAADNT